MKIGKVQVLVLLAVITALVSCEPDTPRLSGKERVKTDASDSSSLEITTALIGVSEIEFDPDTTVSGRHGHKGDGGDKDEDKGDHKGDDDEDEGGDGNNDGGGGQDATTKLAGQFIVNLLDGTSEPDFGLGQITPRAYGAISFKISSLLDDGASAFFALNYVTAYGTTKVEFSTREEFEVTSQNPEGIKADSESVSRLLVLFNINALFQNLDFGDAIADGDGVIRISEDSNPEFFSLIRLRFDDGFRIGKDADGDGIIDN